MKCPKCGGDCHRDSVDVGVGIISKFSELDMDRQLLDAVSIALMEPGSPEQMVEERVARLADEMIDISMLALDPEQRPLVSREWRGVAQILLRAQLIMSVLDDRDVEPIRRLIVALTDTTKPRLTMVSNNG